MKRENVEKFISLKFAGGIDFCFWKDEQCDGCSRYNKQQISCPLERDMILHYMGEPMKKSVALKMGFDEKGNRPEKLKCFRKYQKKCVDKLTGDLL